MEYRLYSVVLYQLNGRQQGLQHGHAVVELGLKYFNDPVYQEWANKYKTFIMLDGGTSEDILRHENLLSNINWPHATFIEPDLNNCMTAIAFIVPEIIYDDKLYPIEVDYFLNTDDIVIEDLIKNGIDIKGYDLYKEIGIEGLILRKLIKGLRLASN